MDCLLLIRGLVFWAGCGSKFYFYIWPGQCLYDSVSEWLGCRGRQEVAVSGEGRETGLKSKYNEDERRFIAKEQNGSQWMDNYQDKTPRRGLLLDQLGRILAEGKPE